MQDLGTDRKALGGGFKELLRLSVPIFFISFSTCLLGFVERLWFSSYSLSTLEASLNGITVLRIFQMPCVALVIMAQAFVGYYQGANEKRAIGQCIWQMLWFSLLSMALVIPLSFYANATFFNGLEIAETVRPYFFILIFANFLFPTGVALSSFYLGRGQTLFISILTVAFHLFNAALDYILIFGIDPWIPSMGLKGAAIAAVVSQSLFCLVLLFLFLAKPYRVTYGTDQWTFNSKTFWHHITPSIPRALGRLALFTVWASNSYQMASKGGDYLAVLSIGGTISLFLAFIGDGILQALVVLISNALGSKNGSLIRKLLGSGLIWIWLIGIVLAIPLIFFPSQTLALFHLENPHQAYLQAALFWVWFHMMMYILNTLPLSLLLANKDTGFLLFTNIGTWIKGFLPVYLGINYFNLPPEKFWLLASSYMICSTLLYIGRILQKKWLAIPDNLNTPNFSS